MASAEGAEKKRRSASVTLGRNRWLMNLQQRVPPLAPDGVRDAGSQRLSALLSFDQSLELEKRKILQSRESSAKDSLHRSNAVWAREYSRDPRRFLSMVPTVPLRPIQLQIHEFIRRRARDPEGVGSKGVLIAEYFGTGKTLGALAHELFDWQERVGHEGKRFDGHPSLIIVPAGLLDQWMEQLHQFIPPGALNVHRVSAEDDSHAIEAVLHVNTDYLRDNVDVVIVTYSALEYAARGLRADERPGLFAIPWRRLIADEATAIINSSSKSFAACMLINAEQRIFISATPARNTVDEIDTALAFVGVHATEKTRKDLLRVVMMRSMGRAIQEQRGLPGGRQPISEQTLWVEFPRGGLEDRLYNGLVSWALQKGVDQLRVNQLMRMLCVTPVMLLTPEARLSLSSNFPNRCASTKIRALIKYIETQMAPQEKVLVYSQWVVALHEVAFHLNRRQITNATISGRVPTDTRHAIRRTFNEEEHPRVLLLNLKVGSVGLNLQRANHVIFLDPWWAPDIRRQAVGRVDRDDQQRPIRVISFLISGSVEIHVIDTQDRKETTIATVLE